jgi:transcriptional regulator with XRE-family HTH domain
MHTSIADASAHRTMRATLYPPVDTLALMADGIRGDVVRRLRRDRGWTQKDLARETGIAQSTLSRIEAGKTVGPYSTTVHVLARVYGCSESELVGDDGVSIETVPADDAAPTLAGKPEAESIAAEVIAEGRVAAEYVHRVLSSGSMQTLNMPLTPAALEALAMVVQRHAERKSR